MALRLDDLFDRTSRRASAPVRSRRTAEPARRSRQPRRVTQAARYEALESRAMLAVTAALTGGELLITLGAANDSASLVYDGTDYTVTGTGLSPDVTEAASGVSSIRVVDGGSGAGQVFTFGAGSTALPDALTVTGVETVTLASNVDIASGNVTVTSTGATTSFSSAAISAGAVSITAGTITANGEIKANANSVSLAATGDIEVDALTASQGGVTVDSSAGDVTIAGAISAKNTISVQGDAVTTQDTIASSNGGAVTIAGSATTWLQADVTNGGVVTIGGGASDTTIGNLGPIAVQGVTVTVRGADVLFNTRTSLTSTAGEVAVNGPAVSYDTLDVTGASGVAIGPITLDAGDLDVTATAGDVALNGDVVATSGTVSITAGAGTLTTHGDITANGALNLTTGATIVATPGKTFTSQTNKIQLDAGTNALQLGDLELDAWDTVTLEGGLAVVSTGVITSQTAGVSIGQGVAILEVSTATIDAVADVLITGGTVTTGTTGTSTGNVELKATTGDLTTGETAAAIGTVSLEAEGGSILAGETAALGDISFAAALDITTSGPITSGTGNILLQGSPIADPAVPAGNITVNADITATAGDVTLLADGVSGTLTLGDGVTVSGDTVTATAQTLDLDGSATIEARSGTVFIPTTVTAVGTLTLIGPTLTVDGFTMTTGSVAIEATAGDITLNGDVTSTTGSIQLTALQGTIANHENLAAGAGITIDVQAFTAHAGFQFTAGGVGTGDVTIDTRAGDLDLSALAAVTAGNAVRLTAIDGNLTTSPITAGGAISLSAGGANPFDVIIGGPATGASITANATGDIVIDDSAPLSATGPISLTAANNVSGRDATPAVSSEIAAQITANAFNVMANGATSPADIRFTNVANDVTTLSIKLQNSAGEPNGRGIEFVNASNLTVTDAITATGTVQIESLSGSLTVNGNIGAGQQVSGITLAGNDGVTTNGTLRVAPAGNASITSAAGAIVVNGAVTVVNGTLTIDAADALAVADALEVSGAGNDITLTSGLGMSLNGDVTSNGGSIIVDAQGGTNGLQASSKLYANDSITITARNGATITAGAGNPAMETLTGPIDVTSAAGPITINGNVEAAAGSVAVTATAGAVTISGDIDAAGAGSEVEVTAGNTLSLTGDVSAESDITLQARTAMTIGSAGSANALTSTSGTVQATSTNGNITLNSAVTADDGSIIVEAAAGTLTINGTALIAAPTYTPAIAPAIPTGLIRLVGRTNLVTDPNLLLVAGRLELTSGGSTDIVMTNPNNALGSVSVFTNGKFEFFNTALLQITDFDAATPSVQISATDVIIESTGGLRVVDGIVTPAGNLLTQLTLETDVPGGVQFVTTSTGDVAAGFSGSLRNMITYVNANRAATANNGATSDRTTITQEQSLLFDEQDAPVDAVPSTITLATELPAIAKPVIFDGTTFSERQVTISGVSVAGNASGLRLAVGSSLSIVRDAQFTRFARGAGVAVASARNQILNTFLVNNSVGLDLSGTTANRNLVGTGGDGNLIEGNVTGIRVRSNAAYNEIYGNTVVASTLDGIFVEASIGTAIGKTTDATFGNEISGNTGNGIRISNVFSPSIPYGATVLNNVIDTNGAAGVVIEGGGRNLVGSDAPLGMNVISNNLHGVVLRSTAAGATQGNLIARNEITGNTRDGIQVTAGFGNVLRANLVDGSGFAGIRIASAAAAMNRPANQVLGNTISGNGDGTTTSDRGGIVLEASSGQLIGGMATTARNIIDENAGNGIVVLSTSPTTGGTNMIVGNTITNNLADGVRIRTSNGNTIQGNLIEANEVHGINVIGATASTAALGNKVLGNDVFANIGAGVRLAGGARTTIGGMIASQANDISSNGGDGILIEANGATPPAFHVVQGNRIGNDGANTGFGIRIESASNVVVDYGNLIAGNSGGGVLVRGGSGITIGSSLAGRGNRIQDNVGNGITVDQPLAGPGTTTAVTIAGNAIERNTGYGIAARGARTSAVTIGRTPSVSLPNGSENVIRQNAFGGVLVDAARQVTIVGNDLWENGATSPDDDIRLVNGANGNPFAPTITRVTTRVVGLASPQYDVTGTIFGVGNQRYFVDLYGNRADGRQIFLGRALVTTVNGRGTFRAVVGPTRQQLGPNGRVISIVATSTLATAGGTSAFSAATPV